MHRSDTTTIARDCRETQARQVANHIGMMTPGEAGDLAGSAAPTLDDGSTCPFCGGTIQRYEIVDSAGERAASLCCGIPQEFLDHYDVFRALPEPLQQVAIERKRAEYAAMEAKSRENARRFRECVERYKPRLEYLRGDTRWPTG